ncbi:MAG: transposase [Gammaproteobacteria bacterium]|nr:transposase [Gammaproteobacteria bacterium]
MELAGGLYHVTARGDGREAIYFGDEDREAWLDVLGRVCDRFNWRCHAWCQMTNHYHLLVETPDGEPLAGMRQLNGVYTQHVNRTHGRVGHVFQGRYTGILVESDSYLLEVARYVVLNPVRARMVSEAGEWPWSSYAAMVGKVHCLPWLGRDWLLGQFAKRRPTAVRRYMDFVRDGVGQPPLWDALQGQVFLGSEAFVERMKARLPDTDLREVPRQQRRRAPPALETFLDMPNPHEGMVAAYRTGAYSMQAVGDAFGVHYSTVSRAVRRAEMNELQELDPDARRAEINECMADALLPPSWLFDGSRGGQRKRLLRSVRGQQSPRERGDRSTSRAKSPTLHAQIGSTSPPAGFGENEAPPSHDPASLRSCGRR